MSEEQITTATADKETRELLQQANEIADLFQRAVELGYSITFSPEQLKLLIRICEEGQLIKSRTDNAQSKKGSH